MEFNEMREYMDLLENVQQRERIITELLSFSRNDLLQMYVEGFNDQEVMEFWLKIDADALPETPEIAREWLMANYAEESSQSIAEMIIDNMDEEEIRTYGMDDVDEDKKDPYDIDYGDDMPELVKAAHEDPQAWHRAMWDRPHNELDEVELDEMMSHSDALELVAVAERNGNPIPRAAQDALDHYENTVEETMDEFGYDEEAEGDRESMVQTQIEDVLTRTNTLMDEIGNEQPTAEQQAALNGHADEITRLEKSLEN